MHSPHNTIFSFHNTKNNYICTSRRGFYHSLGTPSNQSLGLSHEMISWTLSWSCLVENFLGCPCVPKSWFLYSRVYSKDLHALWMLFINYQIFLHSEATPRKKILSLDALLIPILTDRPGMLADLSFSLSLWLCSGWLHYAMELWEDGQLALWGQRKEPWIHGKPMHSRIPDGGNLCI